jgi:hypothetical protein
MPTLSTMEQGKGVLKVAKEAIWDLPVEPMF